MNNRIQTNSTPGFVSTNTARKISENGNVDSCTSSRYKETLARYHHASAQGYSMAHGNICANQQDIPQDDKEAIGWYQKASDRGLAFAQYCLGYMHENGRGTIRNQTQAFKWYCMAANQGEAHAQYSLGFSYEYGRGVAQDYKQAVSWYRLAANQGVADAQSSLAGMYCNGTGVKQDYEEAVMWYQLSANQEHAFSQRILGTLYKYGLGVEQDHMQAIEWYLMAAKLGDSYARHYFNLTDGDASDTVPARQTPVSKLWKNGAESVHNLSDDGHNWQYSWSHLPIYKAG